MPFSPKQISGHPGYSVDYFGGVFSEKYKGFLKPSKTNSGYLNVCLVGYPKYQTTHLIHRLVAISFVPNENNLPDVNHIDRNKKNPIVFNLEWISKTGNMNHHYNGKVAKTKTIRRIRQLSLSGEEIAVFANIKEAMDKTGTNRQSIRLCAYGHQKVANGFKWKYFS